MTQRLIAYFGGEAQKAAIIAELQDHADHDRLIKGRYWEKGKGCAVGCTIQSGNHAEYEPRFGIPQTLARLEDTIFENLPNEHAMKWPVRFMSAIPVGADLGLVQWQFLSFVVAEALNRPEAESVREACQPSLNIVKALARGESVTVEAAESAARSAAAARAAVWSLAAAQSADSAESAAQSAAAAEVAAESAESAARSAAAARAAVWSLAAAQSADSADSAARSAESAESAWIRYADHLITLMGAAPVPAHSKEHR